MIRLALALAYFLSFIGAAILLCLSFHTHPAWAYSGVLLFASGKAIKLSLAGENE